MKPGDIPRHHRPVPRSASDPTAAGFTPADTAAAYGDWLCAVAPGEDVSLSLHIPFCRGPTRPSRSDPPGQAAEARARRDRLPDPSNATMSPVVAFIS